MNRELPVKKPLASEDLIRWSYDDLKQIAAQYLSKQRTGHTLQPTALLHEAYLRLIDGQQIDWQNRSEFCAVVAQTMRWVLVDHARSKSAEKRGAKALRITLNQDLASASDAEIVDVVALDDALNRLAEFNARHARVVELRYFGGLSIEETATALGVSDWTVKNDWRLARAWLMTQL